MASDPSPSPSEIEELRREVASLRARVAALESGIVPDDPLANSPLARLYSGLLELPLVFYRIAPDGRFRDVVGKAIDRIGLNPEALIGRSVLEIFPEAETVFLESLAGNTVWSETSGAYQGRRWAALSFVTLVGNDGGTIGVSLDITDWKETGLQVAASERLFRSLAETVAVAISRTDLVGNVVYANQPMAALLGRPRDEILGRNSMDFVPEEDRGRVLEEWSTSNAEENGFAGVFRVRRSDDSLVWVLGRTVPEVTPGGETTGFVSSLVDINERKQVEEDLSRRVAERTAQLVAANKELEAFCYSVSHDLRSPLRSIDGFCRLLAEDLGDTLPVAGRAYLDRVLAATSRMDGLIDDFLSLSRSSLGDLTRKTVDLSELARRIAEELSQRAPQRSVRFEIASGLTTNGDPALLHDALENLLGNAFKFTARSPDPCIEFFATTLDGGEAAYVVRDNGAGFDMQQASKLFTAFHRLHDERDFEGTGVGLATVERIVQRHGGRIWAEGVPGRGASFTFTIPPA